MRVEGWISSRAGIVSCPARRGRSATYRVCRGWQDAEEIEAALRADILLLNVESSQELEAIHAVAAKLGTRARVALRVNPDVDPQTHPYILTGLRQSKFGVPIQEARDLDRRMQALHHVDPVGVHAHIGSQITQVAPFQESIASSYRW